MLDSCGWNSALAEFQLKLLRIKNQRLIVTLGGVFIVQVVIFTLSNEQFAVETARVQGINDMMEITKVPNAPSYIKGLINLRGNVISLLDINLILNLEKLDTTQNNIIILHMEEELVGIVVDKVDEVLEIDEDIIERVDDEQMELYVKGVINFKDRIVTLIDIDKLLAN